jgi:CspA family cold shock protein
MPNGTVKFFDPAKKFGFVSPDDGGKDVFVPIASLAAAGVMVMDSAKRQSAITRDPRPANSNMPGLFCGYEPHRTD